MIDAGQSNDGNFSSLIDFGFFSFSLFLSNLLVDGSQMNNNNTNYGKVMQLQMAIKKMTETSTNRLVIVGFGFGKH